MRRITGKIPKRRSDGSWDHPSIAESLGDTCIEEIGVYIGRQQNTVVQLIVTSNIMDLCLDVERHGGKSSKVVVGATRNEYFKNAGGRGDRYGGDERASGYGGIGGDGTQW